MINTHGGSRPGSGKKPSENQSEIKALQKKKQRSYHIKTYNRTSRNRGKVREGMFDVHAMENWAI